jgi:hypothetical protein
MKKVIPTLAALASACMFVIPAAHAQAGAAPSVPAASQTSTVTRATEFARQHGFNACAPRLNEMTRMVHPADESYEFLGIWDAQRPNDRMFNALTVSKVDQPPMVTSLTAINSSAGKCDGVITQVLAVPTQSCQQLASNSFAAWKPAARLAGTNVYVREGQPGSMVLLNPLGATGCLVVRQYIAFYAN